MKIYRIENRVTMRGMWYENNGIYNPVITKLTEGISKHLPMDYHSRYNADNKRWYSGCCDKRQMRKWFSPRDVIELSIMDYELFEFDSEEYSIEDNQTIFTRQGLLSTQWLPLTDIWPELEVGCKPNV